MASYSRFALYYDILTKNISYPKRAEYFDSILKKYGQNGGTIVDLACGTGSLSEELLKLGYNVMGIDNSQEMLTMALEKKIENNFNINYIHQDMTKLNLYSDIDVFICALDSLNHLKNISDIQKTFDGVAKYIKDDGLFVFDVNTPYKHKNIIGDNTFVYDADEVYCVWQNTYIEKENKINIHLDFFEKAEDLYFRTEEEFSEVAYDNEEIKKALNNSEFYVENIYDYDTFNPASELSEKVVFVARKKRK